VKQVRLYVEFIVLVPANLPHHAVGLDFGGTRNITVINETVPPPQEIRGASVDDWLIDDSEDA
jgi:hypothetical protein